MTEKTEIKFTEIVQMIADGTVPEGAKFISDDDCVARIVEDPNVYGKVLAWENKPIGFPDVTNRVQLQADVINDQWFMEVPEQELSLAEAIEEWRDGGKVKVECRGETDKISAYDKFPYLWEFTEVTDLDDLLCNSKYYKVN